MDARAVATGGETGDKAGEKEAADMAFSGNGNAAAGLPAAAFDRFTLFIFSYTAYFQISSPLVSMTF